MSIFLVIFLNGLKCVVSTQHNMFIKQVKMGCELVFQLLELNLLINHVTYTMTTHLKNESC